VCCVCVEEICEWEKRKSEDDEEKWIEDMMCSVSVYVLLLCALLFLGCLRPFLILPIFFLININTKLTFSFKKTNGMDNFGKRRVTYGTKLRQFKVKGPK
jgi:hypothetical protein